MVLKENAMGVASGGTTWAFEVGTNTMVCPIIVEDLNPPCQGQMLIEVQEGNKKKLLPNFSSLDHWNPLNVFPFLCFRCYVKNRDFFLR